MRSWERSLDFPCLPKHLVPVFKAFLMRCVQLNEKGFVAASYQALNDHISLYAYLIQNKIGNDENMNESSDSVIALNSWAV